MKAFLGAGCAVVLAAVVAGTVLACRRKHGRRVISVSISSSALSQVQVSRRGTKRGALGAQ